ncbi:MAG: AraC family transcriptional regulator [Calditrichaeota bacterium]|nr:MAG: AraC family transcriptional regulator [Calditrichota bacterium]
MKPIFEKVDLKDDESILAFIYSRDEFGAPWHFHPEYELTLILESSGIRYVGNNISAFEEGDLVLIGSNLPHCWKNENQEQSHSSSLVIQWDKNVLSELPSFADIRNLLNKSQRGIVLELADKQPVIDLMHKVLNTTSIKRYLKLIELLHTISTLNELTLLAGDSYSSDLSDSAINRLEKVQSYVRDNYMNKIKLSDVASRLSLSEQSFSRYFSKCMNRPFFVFLNEYRVNIASRMLVETDYQVTEIAYNCGYESLPFFYKQFQKFKGYSPLEFRKMYQRI